MENNNVVQIKKRGRPKGWRKNVADQVTVQYSAGSKKDTAEGSQSNPVIERAQTNHREIDVIEFAKVAGTWGVTKSLGNYEFARYDVTIEHYCEKGKETEKLQELEKIACDYIESMNQKINDLIFKNKSKE